MLLTDVVGCCLCWLLVVGVCVIVGLLVVFGHSGGWLLLLFVYLFGWRLFVGWLAGWLLGVVVVVVVDFGCWMCLNNFHHP